MKWQVGLYVAAVLIPLVAFAVQALFIRQLKHRNAYIATGAIMLYCLLSLIGFIRYFVLDPDVVLSSHHAEAAEPAHEGAPSHEAEPAVPEQHHKVVWSHTWNWVALGGIAAGTEDRAGIVSDKPDLVVPLGVSIDSLSVVMFLMVTFIASLIHLYSTSYMHGDPRYPRFFTYLSLFCFSMLGLIASANVFMIFVFWELVGVCSYLLIGFWYEEKSNSDAANKAFIVNRVGDVGMLIGLGLLWTSFGTFNFEEINQGLRTPGGNLHTITRGETEVAQLFDPATQKVATDSITGKPREIPRWLLTIAGLGIFAGCVGKSAQFPLHVWLPDAMAGPTPVSALIHAATMVAAGVYLVGRFFTLFTGEVLLYIAYTGGITLFIAATIAMVQTDYKKVLAYSTVSQLGFMMLALGVGGWAAGLFHLITHAFFKALLFLGAGSVYHSVHTYEMPPLGGLFKKMPRTAITMLIGTLAISGVPFFSGFYSKDAILAAALARVEDSPQHILLFVFPAVGAILTAFYMFRMWLLTFAGEPRGYPAAAKSAHGHAPAHGHADDDHAHGHGHDAANPAAHAHESEPIMTIPLIILAVMSVISGWTFYSIFPLPFGTPTLEAMLEYSEPFRATLIESRHHNIALGASLLIMLTGIGVALLYYSPPGFPYFVSRRLSADRTAQRYRGLHNFLVHKWYFDELYWAVFVRPCLAFARLCRQLDQAIVDGLVNAAGAFTTLISRLGGVFDKIAVDELVNFTGQAVYATGNWSRGLQTGKLRNYLMFLAVALVGLFAGVFVWIRG
jgi:proton-translocating NADH-quinone oxidoreductase chain L